MTDRALYQQAKEIFCIAADLTGDERTDFVARSVEGNEALAELVDGLLEGDDDSKSGVSAKLEQGAMKVVAGSGSTDSFLTQSGTSVADLYGDAGRHPERINKYTIVRKVAEGGMGVVYEGVSENPNRRVALKVIRDTHLSAAARRRFQVEIDILAQLEHPGIGRLYDAGMTGTEAGPLQYLAMEFIDGADLLTHASKHGLQTRECLLLFASVVDAVHYAHQKGVIHRDLKPSNILVEAESSMPKILDFGVARMVDPDRQRATMTTDVGQLVGTLSYMSPEQIEGNDASIDIRTDVFALGVVLYELLAGRRPFDIRGLSIVEAGRLICEEPPKRLGAIVQGLSGDVETIVAKALEKRRTDRYQSAAELAADIRRHLQDRPIAARPPSVSDALKKFTRRHAGLVAGLAIALISLVAGTIISTSLAISESRLRTIAESKTRLAEKESAKAKSVVEFLETMFASVSPDNAVRTDVTVLEFLDVSAKGALDEKNIDNATTRAAVLLVLANAYIELGYESSAVPLLRLANQLFSNDSTASKEDSLKAIRLLARTTNSSGNLEEGRALGHEALGRHLEYYGEMHLRTALVYSNLAINASDRGDHELAVKLHRIALEIRRNDGNALNVVSSLASLANTLHQMGRYEESLKLHQEVLILRKRHLPANHPRLAASLNNLGSLYQRLGRFEEAREMLEESLEIRSRVLPDPHPLLALSYNNLATLYMAQNQWGEAVRALKRAIKMHRDLGDGEHPDMAKSMTNLAIVLSKLGDESAAEMQAGALDIMRKHLPPDHPQLGTALHNTAHHQFSAGDVAKAIETVNEARVIFENAFGPKHRTVAYCYHSLATFYANTGQKKQAIKNLQHALEIRKGIYPGAHPETAASHHVMAWLALEFGDVEMARRHAKSAVEMRRRFNTCSDLIDSMMVQLRVEFQAPNPNGDLIKAEIGTLFRQFECIWQHRNRIKEWCSLLAPQFFEDEKVNPLEPHSSNNHQTQEPAAN